MLSIRNGSISFLTILFFASLSLAETVTAPHIRVELISEYPSLNPTKTNWLGVRFEIEKGWHLYWKNPGDSGEPPRIIWQLPPSLSAGEIQWPTPKAIPVGPLMNFGYSDALLLMVPFEMKAESSPNELAILAKVKWLVCQEICIPGEAALKLSLPVSEERQRSGVASLFEEARSKLPQQLPPEWNTALHAETNEFVFSWDPSPFKGDTKLFVFPVEANQVENAAPQTRNEKSTELRLIKSDQLTKPLARFSGLLLVDDKGYTFDVPVTPAKSVAFDLFSLLEALLFAFLGGLILNLMPCVFPVLAIKAIHLVGHAKEQNPRTVRIHGLLYTLGILVSFWALALVILAFRSGGESLGWGFQLQSPYFVAAVADVLFIMALNLLGVFEFGSSFAGVGSRLAARKGYEGSFFTGMLATLVATPCTAPFMGTALAYALGQTSLQAFFVFSALGLGLAAPYLAISFAPGLARILPRPGRWMETFKQLMAFPILGTVIWLDYVLALEIGLEAMAMMLVGLLLLSLAAWAFGHWQGVRVKVAALLIVAAAIYVQVPNSKNATKDRWETFSAAKLEELTRAGQPVFVDFTAAWCVTCKVNEMVAFTNAVMDEMQSKGVVALKADWTNSDAEITKTLASFGRDGVPLYILYSGRQGEAPQVLPQILTPKIVSNALENVRKGGE